MESDEQQRNENSDMFFVDVPHVKDRYGDADELDDERLSQRPQAPPIPGASEALIEGLILLFLISV